MIIYWSLYFVVNEVNYFICRQPKKGLQRNTTKVVKIPLYVIFQQLPVQCWLELLVTKQLKGLFCYVFVKLWFFVLFGWLFLLPTSNIKLKENLQVYLYFLIYHLFSLLIRWWILVTAVVFNVTLGKIEAIKNNF